MYVVFVASFFFHVWDFPPDFRFVERRRRHRLGCDLVVVGLVSLPANIIMVPRITPSRRTWQSLLLAGTRTS